jgi:hypothetical protein
MGLLRRDIKDTRNTKKIMGYSSLLLWLVVMQRFSFEQDVLSKLEYLKAGKFDNFPHFCTLLPSIHQ